MARARSLQSRLSSALAMLLCARPGGGTAGVVLRRNSVAPQGRRCGRAIRHRPPRRTVRCRPWGRVGIRGPPSLPASAPTGPSAPTRGRAHAAPPVPAVPDSAPRASAAARLRWIAVWPDRPSRALGERSDASRPARTAANAADQSGALSGLLAPTATPAARATQLPSQRLLLAKGAFIDCTLETAIDSSLPGMTTCITATDTFSVDGKVVLLERGSKLIGETRGQVQQGSCAAVRAVDRGADADRSGGATGLPGHGRAGSLRPGRGGGSAFLATVRCGHPDFAGGWRRPGGTALRRIRHRHL